MGQREMGGRRQTIMQGDEVKLVRTLKGNEP